METPTQLRLTEREVSMIRMASEGLPNSSLAEHFETSEQVIKNRWKSIYDKLGVRNRTFAVADAIRKGLI